MDDNFVFWPDLVRFLYAKSVLNYPNVKNAEIVPKEDNYPNSPECRSILNFCSILKRIAYRDKWQANSHQQLKKIIKCGILVNTRYILNRINTIVYNFS